MGKHQTCRECHCDFVGPNSSIGENLCGDCGDVIHGDCYIENSALKTRVAELKEQLDRIRKYAHVTVWPGGWEYPIEHNPDANKDMWDDVIAALAAKGGE